MILTYLTSKPSTEGKCYSVKEIGEMLTQTGFREIEFMPAVGKRSVITGKK